MSERALIHATTARPPAAATRHVAAYGAYGCCCPDTAFLRACPLTHGAYLAWDHDGSVDDADDRRTPGSAGRDP